MRIHSFSSFLWAVFQPGGEKNPSDHLDHPKNTPIFFRGNVRVHHNFFWSAVLLAQGQAILG